MAITRYKKHPFSLALLLFAAILSHRAAAETLTQAVIDDYLHIDAPEVDRLATAESLGLAEVSLVVRLAGGSHVRRYDRRCFYQESVP